MAHVVENAAIRNTMLTGFYNINRDYARREERGMEIDRQKDPRQYLYVEMPLHGTTWDIAGSPVRGFIKASGDWCLSVLLQAICFIYVFCSRPNISRGTAYCEWQSIASTLLDGGRTAHSRFKLPIDIEATTICNIRKGTHLGDLMNETTLLVWDEAPMQHRFCMHAVDRMFRDIKRWEDRPSGGIVVCFCGDSRQTLPIIQGGLPAAVVDACLRRSYLWDNLRFLRLTQYEAVESEFD